MKIKDFKMVSHISMADRGILTQSGTIDCEGHQLHGKVLFKTTVTPKVRGEYRKPEIFLSIEGEEKEFKTINGLCKHYKLPIPPKNDKKKG